MTEAGRPGETLRLGNIIYSNCFPVHARLLDRPEPGDPELVDGIPSRLNGMLERAEIDVAPCSSIEYARHADRYRVLPDLVIGSRGPVQSILFLSDRSPTELAGRRVAIPTASATSVVLLKILLHIRWGVRPETFWFDQAREDPFARGASAALFIGDVALRPGLFPVWQVAAGTPAALRELHRTLVDSRAYGREHRAALAVRHAERFGLPARLLDDYWATLTFELDPPMVEGLRTFYRLAAELGEIPRAPEIRWG
jgi:chorismate dehydratase